MGVGEIATFTRIIGRFGKGNVGPTVVFFGGIHGNEPSGNKAMEAVFSKLREEQPPIRGTLYGIRGNIPALLSGKRYLDQDLNRMWTVENIKKIKEKEEQERHREEKELMALYKLLATILEKESGPFYFIDFHTTSSRTLPFITINDAMINRKFSNLFPLPTILGIEEYLEGPLLSYINEQGYLSLGFESGQHIEKEAVENSISFMWLTLVYSGLIPKKAVKDFNAYFRQLKNAALNELRFFEILYRHPILSTHHFKMLPGFKSFQMVKRGELLAYQNNKKVLAQKKAKIFMPLYQNQGDEGFFLIRQIPHLALWLSAIFRKIKFDALLGLLPGVSWADREKRTLMVNIKTARILAKPIFHLLGYRSRRVNERYILMSNREHTAKNSMYAKTWWYKKKSV